MTYVALLEPEGLISQGGPLVWVLLALAVVPPSRGLALAFLGGLAYVLGWSILERP